MRLTNEEIAMKLAGLLDRAIEEVAAGLAIGPRSERAVAMLNAARDGLERLAAELPGQAPAVDPAALGGNVVAFRTGRRASA